MIMWKKRKPAVRYDGTELVRLVMLFVPVGYEAKVEICKFAYSGIFNEHNAKPWTLSVNNDCMNTQSYATFDEARKVADTLVLLNC